MRILCLTKRRPQGRDLLMQPYGRFYHLPKLLAEFGHNVDLMMLSYKRDLSTNRHERNLRLKSVSIFPWGPTRYIRSVKRIIASTSPDWIVGFSDTWYGILAQKLARLNGTRSLVDAYDNYESYIEGFRPLHAVWRHTLANSDLVSAAGPQLAQYMSDSANGRPVDVVPMAADTAFVPMDRYECRHRLGLPVERRLVGYMGAIHPSRGIDFLFEVYQRLKELEPDIELVVSGRIGKGVTLPSDIHWLGYRNPDEVPLILNSLDLLFVLNTPSSFGNFSYPIKLYEAMCCRVPVVASGVSATSWILRDHPQFLATPGSVEEFVTKARASMELERYEFGVKSGWMESARCLESLLLTA